MEGIHFLGVNWGTPFQLITAIGSLGIWASIVTLIIGYWKRGVDIRGLENADEFDLRQHLATELGKVHQRQLECEEREERMRGKMRELEDNLEGVYRMLVQSSAEKVIELGQEVFPQHVIDLAVRTVNYSRKPS
jgi:hypothetical protein